MPAPRPRPPARRPGSHPRASSPSYFRNPSTPVPEPAGPLNLAPAWPAVNSTPFAAVGGGDPTPGPTRAAPITGAGPRGRALTIGRGRGRCSRGSGSLNVPSRHQELFRAPGSGPHPRARRRHGLLRPARAHPDAERRAPPVGGAGRRALRRQHRPRRARVDHGGALSPLRRPPAGAGADGGRGGPRPREHGHRRLRRRSADLSPRHPGGRPHAHGRRRCRTGRSSSRSSRRAAPSAS